MSADVEVMASIQGLARTIHAETGLYVTYSEDMHSSARADGWQVGVDGPRRPRQSPRRATMTPRAIESRAQERASKPIVAPPEAPVITDRRREWRWQRMNHLMLGHTPKLKIWRA